MQPKFRINLITGLEIIRGDQNFIDTQTHTHTDTHTQTHTHTHTDTHTPAAYLISLFFLFLKKETRLKGVNCFV